ncbi:MAG TPA: iron-containing alcohol dehydrogenase [Verrucomicrobiae bacterium]
MRIVFGPGAIKELPGIARELGRQALIVTGSDASRAARIVEEVQRVGVSADILAVVGEPTLDLVVSGVPTARERNCDLVIGIGGGSAIDAGKAIAAMLTNEGELLDYLEVIGRGKALGKPSAPFIAIPTTAGTGAEVTRNAVLGSSEHRVKVSLRSALMLPRVALIDPELALTLPPAVTASTGLDALTQLIEPYVCNRANPMTDALCVEGIRRAARSLLRAVEQGSHIAAREDMALAALFSGVALANAGLGAVHGFAAPIGGMFSAPHGAVCAALLPHVMGVNIRALRARAPQDDLLRRYDEVARLLTGSPAATASDGIRWTGELVRGFGIPPLSRYGITRADVPTLVEKSTQASSMKANPIALTSEELKEILERAL